MPISTPVGIATFTGTWLTMMMTEQLPSNQSQESRIKFCRYHHFNYHVITPHCLGANHAERFNLIKPRYHIMCSGFIFKDRVHQRQRISISKRHQEYRLLLDAIQKRGFQLCKRMKSNNFLLGNQAHRPNSKLLHTTWTHQIHTAASWSIN